MSIVLLLAIVAFICAVVSAMGKCPLWVSVILLSLAILVTVLPLK